MKILIVGKGGREHALARALHEAPTPTELFSFPGSDAIATLAPRIPGEATFETVTAWIETERPDLVVAGEEAWLVHGEGLANACERLGVPCWGPHRESAMLEASKAFAKDFMVRHGIPTGGSKLVATADEAREAIAGVFPTVLKFDGLAAGKGVAVCPDAASADEFLDTVFTRKLFGEGSLLVEEFLTGPEISIFAAVSDGKYQILCPARDYKRLADGDQGPNTGGMGAIAGHGLIDPETLARIDSEIVARTIDGLVADALPYRGFLYFGIMLTPDGPKILEYNCRFGDPECQAVMPLCEGDLARYCWAGASGRLEPDAIQFSDDWAVTVVLASAGYPASSRSGDPISGLDQLPEDIRAYHAGTRRETDGTWTTNGGRILAITARAATRDQAIAAAHDAAALVTFPGSQRRSDIGK